MGFETCSIVVTDMGATRSPLDMVTVTWRISGDTPAPPKSRGEIPVSVIGDAIDKAIAEEREACAKLAELWWDPAVPDGYDYVGCVVAFSEGQDCSAPDGIAKAIRERGTK